MKACAMEQKVGRSDLQVNAWISRASTYRCFSSGDFTVHLSFPSPKQQQQSPRGSNKTKTRWKIRLTDKN